MYKCCMGVLLTSEQSCSGSGCSSSVPSPACFPVRDNYRGKQQSTSSHREKIQVLNCTTLLTALVGYIRWDVVTPTVSVSETLFPVFFKSAASFLVVTSQLTKVGLGFVLSACRKCTAQKREMLLWLLFYELMLVPGSGVFLLTQTPLPRFALELFWLEPFAT